MRRFFETFFAVAIDVLEAIGWVTVERDRLEDAVRREMTHER
jgi:hypothetical protein